MSERAVVVLALIGNAALYVLARHSGASFHHTMTLIKLANSVTALAILACVYRVQR